MKANPLPLSGAFHIAPTIHEDKRGYFFEWLNTHAFEKLTGITFNPIQFNYSKSKKGVLRGLHFQKPPYSQAKLVAVTKGKIQDVIVDVRKDSPTFGQHLSIIVSADKKNQIFIPKGFAHGFLVLTDEAEIFYAIDNHYSPEHEAGICFNDPALNIEWQMDETEITLSERDKTYGVFASKTLKF